MRQPNLFEWWAIEAKARYLNTPQSVTASYKRVADGLVLDCVMIQYPDRIEFEENQTKEKGDE